MKFQLRFNIECGKDTCASEPGNFCIFFTNTFNGQGKCHFFGELLDRDGWIQRDQQCKEFAIQK